MLRNINRVVVVLGTVFGALSLLQVANLIAGFEYAQVTELIVGFYKTALDAMFGWAHPYLAEFVAYIGGVFHLKWTLYKHWHYVFVLLWLYLSGDARANLSLRRYKWGILFFLWGFVVALATSLATGTAPIDERMSMGAGAFYPIEVFPILGIVLFEFGKNVLVAAFKGPSRPSTESTPFLASLLTLVTVYTLPVALLATPFILLAVDDRTLWLFGSHSTRSLVLLVSFILAAGVLWLARGYIQARMSQTGGQDARERTENSASTRFGRWVLYTTLGGLAFIVLNMGLKSYGL